MQTIKVKTGYGYYRDGQGHVISKAELPVGDHELADGLNYIEVATKAEHDAIEIWIDPVVLERQQNENKIQAKIRKMSIKELIKDGELPAGYE